MKNQNTLIIFSILTLVSISVFTFWVQPSYEISFVDVSVTTPIANSSHAINGINYISIISETNDQVLTYIASTGVLFATSATFTTVCETGGTGGTCVPRAMTCSGSICYVLASVTVGVAVCRFLEVTVGSSAIVKYTSASACNNAFAKNGGSIYYVRINGGADELNALNTSTNPYNATVLSADLGVGSVYCLQYMTLSSISYLGVCSDVANNWFKLYRLDTATLCTVGASTFTAINAQPYSGKAYVIESGGTIKVITSACAISSTIAAASTCGGTGQDILITSNKLFAGCESTKNVGYYNLTSNSLVATYDCGFTVTPASNTVRMIAYNGGTDTLSCMAYTGNEVRFMLGITGTSEGGDIPSECASNPETLRCRLAELEGNALGSASESTATSLNNMFVQIGLVEEGSDITTNGVGYMIVVVLMGIMVAMFALASNMELNRIPTFVWFLGALAILGASAGFGVVDATFFIIGILVIIALASAKILSTLELGGFR